MTLSKETMITQERFYDPSAIKNDVLNMDEDQLTAYLGAVLLGFKFSYFNSINFLPYTAAVQRDSLAIDMGYLYYEDHPDFKTQLNNILSGILVDRAEGRDVLARFGHSTDNPWADDENGPYLTGKRHSIVQGCIDVVSTIVYLNTTKGSVDDTLSKAFDSNEGGVPYDQLVESVKSASKDSEDKIRDDVLRLAELVRSVVEKESDRYQVGGVLHDFLNSAQD